MSLFRGCGVALVTPFKNNKVNYEKLEELIEWHIKQDTDAIIICGTTGEATTLSDEEQKEIIKFTVQKVNKRIPVIAGTGSNCTQHAIDLSKYAEQVGTDGLLVITPYYNKSTQKGLIAHFTAIANEVSIPIIIYNVPGRTGVNMLPSTLAELAKLPNIKAIKEASGNISQVAEIARLVPDDFYIYSGNDDMIVPLMSLKGDGVISVVANIVPKDTHDLVYKFINGDLKGSCDLQLKLKPLIDALFIEVNPIPVKTAMNLMGFAMGNLRLPLVEMSDSNLEILKTAMKEYGLL
ncbi:4-hydroxy-tetrahydrodipicolinate synthase [Paramaledivibacter caminithermalis]|uniref:4-hydroxy-tetrahydrodipicolinate synthase n=1 Tax=Paramaledivibacter caminithermalis (strain DSM 15212 / CIP 107654 / DViRD3) TaxID=1121301 RepID=A0A1M6PZD5_PARC5|nr:4-hydroxy-tetrahydrodipicolinate synthase [Paramaledivibacter caminithermalis]SHK13310.1 4-hydroxy-tetrahydrodipicolinate synthase [Paramaledivibacter caminithermalis DSM 15212]